MKNTLRLPVFIAAGILLITMGGIMISTIAHDSLTIDEDPHIGAGYSYLKYRDYRLNPEHPPLMKDLAAIPLLFMDLSFPDTIREWTTDINGQWMVGREFIFSPKNDADKIIFWARVPMIFLTILLGWFVFRWAFERHGNAAALITVFFFAFSPAFIAHGRLVTTDVAAAAGFFIAIYYFIHFLQFPSWFQLAKAGLALGFALLLKFSVVLLIPFFIGITLLWIIIRFVTARTAQCPEEGAFAQTSAFKLLLCYFGSLILIFTIALALIWIVYGYHVLDYPPERQLSDTKETLKSFGFHDGKESFVRLYAVKPVIWMADKPFLRAIAHYFFGFLMVFQRTVGGNTTYFLGQVSNEAWWTYFPTLYVLKEPLAFLIAEGAALILSLAAFIRWLVRRLKRTSENDNKIQLIAEWCDQYFTEITMVLFIAMYWYTSMTSNLNIGIRHILPSFPFFYILASFGLVRWIRGKKTNISKRMTLRAIIQLLKRRYARFGIGSFILFIILLWYGASSTMAYPHYIPYFNEIAGGSENGYRYAVDSNFDWGQDLKRLAAYVEERQIDSIALHYFGWAPPQYYMGDRFVPWWFENGKPDQQWFAISATFLQGSLGSPNEAFIERVSSRINEETSKDVSIAPEYIRTIARNADYSVETAFRHYQFVVEHAKQNERDAVNADDIEALLQERTYTWLKDYPIADRVGRSIFIYKTK